MNRHRSLNPRRLALHAFPLLASIVVAGSTLVYADRVPERVASHWSGSVADGWMAVTTLTLVSGGLVLFLGFGLMKLAMSAARGAVVRPLVGLAVGLSAFLATLHVVTLQASVGADLGEAVPFPTGGLLNAVAIAVVAGVLGWAIAEPGADAPVAPLAAERLEVLPGEAVVWTGGASASRMFLALPIVIGVGGIILAAVSEPLAGAALVLAAVIATSISRVRVTIGPAGLRVRSGPFGLLSTRVPLAEVAAVHAEHVDPMAYGGWGLRIVPGARAVVVRSGEGLRVERSGKPDLVVTVDDAPRGAGVLLAHTLLPPAAERPSQR